MFGAVRDKLAAIPFSILGRIGGDATRNERPEQVKQLFLSVSSVGSEAMQLRKRPYLAQAILLSVSSVGSEAMQPSPRPAMRCMSLAFSILGRIGGDATHRRVMSLRGSIYPFQYPRSDRRRCNLLFRAPIPWNCSTFSILGRIGGDATACSPLRILDPTRLSVSSVGSEAMQRRLSDRLRRLGADFQYPRSDRRRCNQALAKRFAGVEYAFSILGRIGGDATRRKAR